MKNPFSRVGDDRGQILLLTAFSMVALLGIASLALDASYMYDKRNHLFSAADAAAKSGAIEVHRNSGVSNTALQAFANQQVAAHGFSPDTTTTVTVHHAPVSGPFAGNTGYVEVIVSEQTSTFIGRILGLASMTPTARAVAGTSSGPDCIVTLGGSPSGLDIGVAHIDMPGCSIADNGDMSVASGNASVVASDVSVVGTCTGTNCPGNLEHGSTVSDPLAGQLDPPPAPDPSTCTGPSVGASATLSLTAGCYSSITLGNNSTLLLGPGIYYVTGPITTGNSARICLNAACTFDYGNGVLIYMTGGGEINLPNGPQVVLNAMTSGPYNGILFYQDPSDTNAATFRNGSASFDLSGAMYFPTADVVFQNGGSTNDCSLFVANSLTLGNGQNTFSNTCSHYGGSPILTVSMAE
jgi:Flp pilus assembly protein TadG